MIIKMEELLKKSHQGFEPGDNYDDYFEEESLECDCIDADYYDSSPNTYFVRDDEDEYLPAHNFTLLFGDDGESILKCLKSNRTRHTKVDNEYYYSTWQLYLFFSRYLRFLENELLLYQQAANKFNNVFDANKYINRYFIYPPIIED